MAAIALPNFMEAHYRLRMTYLALGRYEEALEAGEWAEGVLTKNDSCRPSPGKLIAAGLSHAAPWRH